MPMTLLRPHRSLPFLPALTVLLVATVMLTAAPALAQGLDLTGDWTLSATGLLPEEGEPCVFEGGGSITQEGSLLTGQVTLRLVSGPVDCPVDMMATLDGSLDGGQVFGVLDGGQLFGTLDFAGSVAQDGQSMEGTYTVGDGGPFQDVEGDWSGSILLSILQIPTLGGIALGLLVLLLASASILLLRRGA